MFAWYTGWGLWSWIGFSLLRFGLFNYLHSCAWADGSLAELAVQLGKMVEHLNQSLPNPGPQPPAPPCIDKTPGKSKKY